jgi:hypothetical protein
VVSERLRGQLRRLALAAFVAGAADWVALWLVLVVWAAVTPLRFDTPLSETPGWILGLAVATAAFLGLAVAAWLVSLPWRRVGRLLWSVPHWIATGRWGDGDPDA